jgi:hypothetical protein
MWKYIMVDGREMLVWSERHDDKDIYWIDAPMANMKGSSRIYGTMTTTATNKIIIK